MAGETREERAARLLTLFEGGQVSAQDIIPYANELTALMPTLAVPPYASARSAEYALRAAAALHDRAIERMGVDAVQDKPPSRRAFVALVGACIHLQDQFRDDAAVQVAGFHAVAGLLDYTRRQRPFEKRVGCTMRALSLADDVSIEVATAICELLLWIRHDIRPALHHDQPSNIPHYFLGRAPPGILKRLVVRFPESDAIFEAACHEETPLYGGPGKPPVADLCRAVVRVGAAPWSDRRVERVAQIFLTANFTTPGSARPSDEDATWLLGIACHVLLQPPPPTATAAATAPDTTTDSQPQGESPAAAIAPAALTRSLIGLHAVGHLTHTAAHRLLVVRTPGLTAALARLVVSLEALHARGAHSVLGALARDEACVTVWRAAELINGGGDDAEGGAGAGVEGAIGGGGLEEVVAAALRLYDA